MLVLDSPKTVKVTAIVIFWTVLLISSSICVISFIVWLFWLYFTGEFHGPYGIIIAPLMGLVVGIIETVSNLSGALVVAALAVAAAAKAFGRVPLWLLVSLVPACGITIFLQVITPPHYLNPWEGGPHGPHKFALRMFFFHVLPGLVGSWLWLFKKAAGASASNRRDACRAQPQASNHSPS